MSCLIFFTQAAHNPVLGLTCLAGAGRGAGQRLDRRAKRHRHCGINGVLSFRRAGAGGGMQPNGRPRYDGNQRNGGGDRLPIAIPDRAAALSALCAALCAIVLWAVLAWRFGVPTSESHALVAGLTGAALALPGGLDNIRAGAWGRVLLGLVLSVALGWWVGGLCRRLLERLHPSLPLCRRGQLAGAGAMAFLHGAQDGQKFLGVFLLGAALAQGGGVGQTFSVPGWLMLLCAAVMALGTAMGGRRIIETVGRDMVILAPREGLAADLGGGLCLLLCTLAGLPVSTTHAKTAAILGAGSAGGGTVNHRVAARIALTWLFTFPGCGLLGFLLASLFRSPLSCGILMPGTIF